MTISGENDIYPAKTTVTRSQKSMSKKYAYFYLMKKEPEKIEKIIPQHIEYWQILNIDGYLGGPFADRSGGLITFTSDNIDQAMEIVKKDPFYREDLLAYRWIKEWLVE